MHCIWGVGVACSLATLSAARALVFRASRPPLQCHARCGVVLRLCGATAWLGARSVCEDCASANSPQPADAANAEGLASVWRGLAG